ncbi:protein brambleberry [Diachasma alloeum]|uniref:protein brambleberry n=1 Tax=Diachasma alloeum TaxID=454923 RepID=UPI0007381FFF|nr:protein brambleberry [Diachasma alloeum]
MEISLLITLALTCVEASSILNWMWSKSPEEPDVSIANGVPGVPLIAIPYESMTDDEKFLQEAAKFTDIQVSSPLQLCQHKVIMRIQSSCSKLSEEELAKLSVNLLNCQSAVEGRKMFPCSEKMSLKQCTIDMDADMWNAYHLMSNRARAVCYAARNIQFRALTELTVNKLMHTTRSQIEALGSLKDSYERLETHTIDALSSLSKGNRILLEQQKHLEDSQSTSHRLVANNLRQLTNEKYLIRSGHTLLASMTEDIRTRLEKANQDLMTQASERQENHQELLKDLMDIQKKSQLIWEKIEESTKRIVEQNADAVVQYELIFEKLEKINNTIHFIWNVTESMRQEIDEKLGWITDYIGNTGEQLQRIYRISLHIIYLLAAMIVAAFLNAPFLTRATIMGFIPLNLITFLKHGMNACLDFTSITVLIFFITAMHYVMLGIQQLLVADVKMINSKKHSAPQRASTPAPGIVPNISYTARLMKNINGLFDIFTQQLIHLKEKIGLVLQSASSWCCTNTTPVEELSCSYIPSKLHREDRVMDYNRGEDSSILSDDVNHSHLHINQFNDTDDLQDANELRRRILSKSSTSNYSVSPSRSVTPNSATSPRTLCWALTKTGAKCRSRAQPGRYFCGRHSDGSSILGD